MKRMKTSTAMLFVIATLCVAACHTIKPSTTFAPEEKPTIVPRVPIVSTGIFEPGMDELTAIQVKHKDATLDQLKEGYLLYTQGACISCHEAKNIYNREEWRWEGIIDNMAAMAKLSAMQKDAVYKYVLAIKATQKR